MKMRMGFVSNSSSSSFCLLGVEMPKGEKWGYIAGLSVEWGIYDLDRESSFYGIYPQSIGEDETIGQVRNRIVEILKKEGKTIKKKDIRWYEDGGYNG